MLDSKQMEYTNQKDEQWKSREEKKQQKRRTHAQNLMNESLAKQRKEEAQLMNGGKRGEKMTKEEIRLNKELLKEVSMIKKSGNMEQLLEMTR